MVEIVKRSTISVVGQFVTLSVAKGLETREILRYAQNDIANWPTTTISVRRYVPVFVLLS